MGRRCKIKQPWISIFACSLFLLINEKSIGAFPIATNSSAVEICAGLALNGTNYAAALSVGTNVCVRMVSTNGLPVGLLLTNGGGATFLPPAIAIASNLTNSLIAWSDGSVANAVDMFGQRISQSGSPVGARFSLLASKGSHGVQVVKALASDGTNFFLIWQDKTDKNFYGQLIAANGTLSGQEFLISYQQPGGSFGVAAGAFGKTNYLVAWQASNGNKTYGQIVSPAGITNGVFQISQSSSADVDRVITAFDKTNYLVVWSHDTIANQTVIVDWDLYGRLVSAMGSTLGSELLMVTNSGDQDQPTLVFDGANYLLAWRDYVTETNLTTTNTNVRFSFFNPSGQQLGPSFTLFSSHGSNAPMFTFNGALYDGKRLAVAATLCFLAVDASGNIMGVTSGEVEGSFVPASTTPPQLSALNSFANGQFSVLFTGTPGINYGIQTATNLVLTNWAMLSTNSPTNGAFIFTDTSATNSSRFYRAIAQ
jgi:hypothetical protein